MRQLLFNKRPLKLVLLLILISMCGVVHAQDAGELTRKDLDFTPVVTYKHAGFGVGYGIPYSGFGFSGDYFFTGDLGVTGSLGAFGYLTGYEIGLKYYLRPYYKPIRPKLTLLYGTNQGLMIDNEPDADVYEVFHGLSAAAGVQWMFGKDLRHGFDMDLVYVVFSGMTKRLEELEDIGYIVETKRSKFKIAMGYRYMF